MLDKITGELRVFAKFTEKGVRLSAQIGAKKLEDGTWLNAYIPVNLSNELKEKAEKATAKYSDNEYFDCMIADAWFTAYKAGEYVKPILFINKAKIIQ